MSPYADRNDPKVRERLERKYAAKRKWMRHEDGLFHCSDQHPGCTYTHQRAASVGRHTVTHTGKPYAGYTPAEQRKRDYAKEYYRRYNKAKQVQKAALAEAPNPVGRPPKEPKLPKETTHHVNGTNSHAAEFDNTRYFLAGSFVEQIKSAARALDCSEGELTSGIFQILRAATVR